MRALIYTRVSTNEQAESGLGLEAQMNACLAKAKELGAIETIPFTDAGLSGSTEIEERPGLWAALSQINRGDVLIVAKRDRVARDMFLALSVERMIRAKKATFVSVAGEGSTDDLSGLMQRRMSDLFAEIEREMIRTRTKAAMQTKKAKGEYLGTVPFGYKLCDDGIHLEPDTQEQDVVTLVQSLRKKLSFRAIVKYLNDNGIPSRTGHRWNIQQVFNIAKSKAVKKTA
jgi:DNA invertase Pin-like site-specific DNA recombinase